jgi:hypothetical protein
MTQRKLARKWAFRCPSWATSSGHAKSQHRDVGRHRERTEPFCRLHAAGFAEGKRASADPRQRRQRVVLEEIAKLITDNLEEWDKSDPSAHPILNL